MKIYLDNCCCNRPFDDQSQIKEGAYDLVWSYILDYENGKNTYEEKRLAIVPWKEISSFCVAEETEDILLFAESLVSKGIKTYDAIHFSCAIAAVKQESINALISELG